MLLENIGCNRMTDFTSKMEKSVDVRKKCGKIKREAMRKIILYLFCIIATLYT